MNAGTKTTLVMVSMGVTLSIATSASAQIDKRVNTGNGHSGRLHDANPGVGSGGVNLARPTYDYGGRSDAIITGNVSGLGYFKGNSPLMQNNAFRGSLGSNSLSGFQRQSVGITDVLANRTITPGYFYDTQTTIADLGDIRRGLTRPGSSMLSTYAVTPIRGGGYQESPLDLGIRNPVDHRIGVPGRIDPSQRSIPSASPMAFNPLYFDRAADSSIFGPPRNQPSVFDQLAERRAARRDLIDRMSNDLQRTELEDALARRDAGLPQATPPTMSPPTVDSTMPPSIASINVTGGDAVVDQSGLAGGDRFSDMIGAIRAEQDAGRSVFGFTGRGDSIPESESDSPAPSETPATADASPTRVDFGRGRGRRSAGLTEKPGEGTIAAASAAKWAGISLDDPVASFASANASEFNRYMVDGEEAMHDGRYFDASRHFDMASVIDRRNPLPLLARGHALAAAGNYMSAVHSLTRGIAQFPQIAAFKLDLPGMVGRSDVFDRRRAELEQRLAHVEDRDLRFLLGYLELYSGLPDLAQKNLNLAAKGAPEDSVIAQFPNLVFGRAAIPMLKPESHKLP